MLKIWYNESDWVIAENKEDAVKVWEEFTGDKWSNYNVEWVEDNREYWTIVFDEMDNAIEFSPKEAEIYQKDKTHYIHAKATQDQWIQKIGRGWFCSENW